MDEDAHALEAKATARNSTATPMLKTVTRFVEHGRRYRWSCLAVIALIGGLAIWAIQIQGWSVTRPSRDVVVVIGLINLTVFGWIFLLGQFSPLRRQVVVLIWGLLQVGLFFSLRVDGFAGDGRPLLNWRWTQTAEERYQSKARFASSTLPADMLDDLGLNQLSPGDSPAFRGTDRTGKYRLDSFLTDWDSKPPRELWRRAVGPGWSSFAAVGRYCVTQEQRGDQEAVVCYEIATGREVWVHLDTARFEEITSGIGPRATPCIDSGRVYSLGASGILNCLNGNTGEPLWTVATQRPDDKPLIFGASSSPLVVSGTVIVATRADKGEVSAYDCESGEPRWASETAAGSYSSPHLLHMPTGPKVEPAILNFDNVTLRMFDSRGEERWALPWGEGIVGSVNVSQPVVLPVAGDHGAEPKDGDIVDILISASYGRGVGMFRVNRQGDDVSVRELWRTQKMRSKFACVMVHEGSAYGLDDGIFACIDLADGQRRWKRGRYGHGQIVMLNDVLLIQAESGDIVLVATDPDKHVELARFSAFEDRTWNHPVVVGRYLLLRNDREAVCYELPCE